MQHPISLARMVMERTEHVMMAGEGEQLGGQVRLDLWLGCKSHKKNGCLRAAGLRAKEPSP